MSNAERMLRGTAGRGVKLNVPFRFKNNMPSEKGKKADKDMNWPEETAGVANSRSGSWVTN